MFLRLDWDVFYDKISVLLQVVPLPMLKKSKDSPFFCRKCFICPVAKYRTRRHDRLFLNPTMSTEWRCSAGSTICHSSQCAVSVWAVFPGHLGCRVQKNWEVNPIRNITELSEERMTCHKFSGDCSTRLLIYLGKSFESEIAKYIPADYTDYTDLKWSYDMYIDASVWFCQPLATNSSIVRIPSSLTTVNVSTMIRGRIWRGKFTSTKVAMFTILHLDHNSLCCVSSFKFNQRKWASLTILYHHLASRQPTQTRYQVFAMKQ